MKVYTIYDSAALAYMRPFFSNSHGEAIRAFRHLAQDPETNIARDPDDYTLFYIGDFDELIGIIDPQKTPHSLGCAVEYTQPQLMQEAN